jgi:hypothetical protein
MLRALTDLNSSSTENVTAGRTLGGRDASHTSEVYRKWLLRGIVQRLTREAPVLVAQGAARPGFSASLILAGPNVTAGYVRRRQHTG